METLPPPPKPNRALQRVEERRGILLVGSLIVAFVSITCVLMTRPRVDVVASWVLIGAINAQAVFAIGCTLYVLFGDAGVIERSEETCLPIPPVVAERLAAGESLDGLANPVDDTSSYCVRCCVWRRPGRGRAHHCSTCQRCVVTFDHHCGVFGRCIAGSLRRWRGNMPYFVLLIATGLVAAATTLSALVVFLRPIIGDRAYYLFLLCVYPLVGHIGITCQRRCSRTRPCCWRFERECALCCPALTRAALPPVPDFTEGDARRLVDTMNQPRGAADAAPLCAPTPSDAACTAAGAGADVNADELESGRGQAMPAVALVARTTSLSPGDEKLPVAVGVYVSSE